MGGSLQNSNQPRTDSAMITLREARSDDERQAARTEMRKVLASIFAEDMQAREKQVKEIEARIERLRQQYRSREQVMDQIIDLQLKVLENDAAGLGFPSGAGASSQPVPMGWFTN